MKIEKKAAFEDWTFSIYFGPSSFFPSCFGEFYSNTAIEKELIARIISIINSYWKTLVYTVKCKRAEMQNNKIEQKRWFERLVNEDSDVALVRIFECFLEAAPQKILQISIILSGEEEITRKNHNELRSLSKNVFIDLLLYSSSNAEFVQFHVQYGLVHCLISQMHSIIPNRQDQHFMDRKYCSIELAFDNNRLVHTSAKLIEIPLIENLLHTFSIAHIIDSHRCQSLPNMVSIQMNFIQKWNLLMLKWLFPFILQDFSQFFDPCCRHGPVGVYFRSISILFKYLDSQFTIFIDFGLCVYIQLYSTESTSNSVSIRHILYDLLFREYHLCGPLCDPLTRRRQTRGLFPHFVHFIDCPIYRWCVLYDFVLFMVSSESR